MNCFLSYFYYKPIENLTLTRVVFEYYSLSYINIFYTNLTLTRVVFECFVDGGIGKNATFNFNKSCIWIGVIQEFNEGGKDLTLTRVVFE